MAQDNLAFAASTAEGRNRLPAEFPDTDLGDAVGVAVAIHKHVGEGGCFEDQLAPWLSQSLTSDSFRVRLAASRIFGLVDIDAGGLIKLTERGRAVVDPKQERAARAAAFLSVPLYRALYEKYKATALPPSPQLEREIAAFGVPEKQKERARKVLERSAEQAGCFETGRDRPVAPVAPPRPVAAPEALQKPIGVAAAPVPPRPQPHHPLAQERPPFVDNPNLAETFADGISSVAAGAGVVALTLTVSRPEEGNPPRLMRVPAARLVVTLPAAIELHQRLTQVLLMLQQQSAAKSAPAAPEPKTVQ